MASNYVEIEGVTGGVENLIKQDMKFKTGNFVWRIKFTAPLNPATVNNMNLYVTSINESPLKTAIRYDAVNNYIEIEPLEAYAKNESYILNISKNVESKGGQKLKNDIRLRFKI
ncbi:MAG: Ig-like domain-containing protein [Clostridiales bacterium]|nr:Ig-like domain-containing protein [Clostridiales bacterium]